MAFEFCCFISYPHGQQDVLVPIVKDFVEGLETELGALTRQPIWFDRSLRGGSLIDPAISTGICKSVCMIMIYTPLYFDKEHTYCAQELKAMQDLELQRVKHLTDRSNGLIIPIILRGKKKFPETMKKRKFYDFTDYLFNSSSEKLRQAYAAQISEIAEYILDCCDSLENAAEPISHDCDKYGMPTSDDAKEFVESVLKKEIQEVVDSFPTRKESVSEEISK